MTALVGPDEIAAASERLRDWVVDTPTRRSRIYSDRLGASVHFKYETLQTTGSFKVRGALNTLLSLDAEARRRGVIAASAGNHAQGVAYAAASLEVPATIVMPEPTPQIKVENTEAHGSGIEVVLHGETFDDAYRHARDLQRRHGRIFVHPFDDPRVIAGQGTIGDEILAAVPNLEAVVVPIGGGGLISGVAAALRAARPKLRIYGVQTEAAPAMKRSFDAGAHTAVPQRPTIAEGISVKEPGTLTLAHIQALVDDVVLVSELAIETAVVELMTSCKTVIEGAAAAAVAALEGPLRERIHRRTVAAVISGGNIDLGRLNLILERALARRHLLVRLRATLDDRPGTLVDFLAVIAAQRGNVVRVIHDRVFGGSRFGEADVVVTLEVRNQDHIAAISDALARQGHPVTEVGKEPDMAPPGG